MKVFSYALLSHVLSNNTPLYGGDKSIRLNKIRKIADGDSCNTQEWHITNHSGTHIDAPNHFFDEGKTIDEYDASFWIVKNVNIAFCEMEEGRWIMPHDLNKYVTKETECLLIKTGFQNKRGAEEYYLDNPGISPEAGKWLRENYPAIRFIGMDFLSVSRFKDRSKGRDAHRELLRPFPPGRSILPIEDMDLSTLGSGIKVESLCIAPLIAKASDSAPATVLATIYHD